MEVINTFICPVIRHDFVLLALKSLRAHTPPNFKIITVNQSQPNREFEESLYLLSDLVIRPHVNYGFAQGANLGIRLSPTQYVTVMNDDLLFYWDGWWPGILETFERFPKAAAVNPQSVKEPGWGWAEPGYRYLVPKDYPDKQLQQLGAEELAVREEFRTTRLAKQEDDGLNGLDRETKLEMLREDMLRLRAQLAPLVQKRVLSDPKYTELLVEQANWAVVDAFACWCTVFRADALADIGLFDERFFPGGGEDYAWCHDCYAGGYRALSTSRSHVWHYWGQSKDSPSGFDTALPPAREQWNKLSTKGFGDEGLFDPDCSVWGEDWSVRTDPIVYQAPL